MHRDCSRRRRIRSTTECLTKLDDYQSLIPTFVEASPFEDAMLQYTSREHGDYAKYLGETWGAVSADDAARAGGNTSTGQDTDPPEEKSASTDSDRRSATGMATTEMSSDSFRTE